MMISYAVTVKDELDELKKLLAIVIDNKRDEDEIVVLSDTPVQEDVVLLIKEIQGCNRSLMLVLEKHSLNGDFASHKNYLNGLCVGDWIFQIDADEVPSEYLLEHLPGILENDVDLIWVPRVNTVEGLTDEHVQKWGWVVDRYNRVNWPDWQGRIYRNDPEIKWVNKVHEKIVGAKKFTKLPAAEYWAIDHHKTIKKQESQNKLYETL